MLYSTAQYKYCCTALQNINIVVQHTGKNLSIQIRPVTRMFDCSHFLAGHFPESAGSILHQLINYFLEAYKEDKNIFQRP